MYTNIVYENKKIIIANELDYRSMKTSKDIGSQELLLIEHVLSGTGKMCLSVIRDNKYLFNELHPRTSQWDETNLNKQEIIHLVNEKLQKNAFGDAKDTFAIGDHISKINHSCIPNAMIVSFMRTYDNLPVIYLCLYSVKNIKSNEEVHISYGNKRGHFESDDFICYCNKTYNDRIKINHTIKNMGSYILDKNLDHIKDIIEVYEKSDSSREIMKYQYLALNGLRFSSHDLCIISSKFSDIINEKYNIGTFDDKKKKYFEYVNDLFNHDFIKKLESITIIS